MRGIQVTTYNPNSPIHGGKIRSRALSEIFVATFGPQIEVKNYYIGTKIDSLSVTYKNLPQIEDVLTADYLESMELQEDVQADYVVCEQPWGWPLVASLKSRNPKLLTIYSSQNIESSLKERILSHVDSTSCKQIITRIKKLEIQAAGEADLVIVCSHSDRDWFENNGVEKKKIIYIPNSTNADRFTSTLTTKNDDSSYFLLASSSYGPTNESFMDLFAAANQFLPPKTEIKVVGGISNYLATTVGSRRATDLDGAIHLLGVVTDQKLHQLLNGAMGIILPVKFGGGTNLKTAEALYYNKEIIATREAFRGFEGYINASNVQIVRDTHDAMIAVWKAINRHRSGVVDEGQMPVRDELTWSYWTETGPKIIREALSL